MRSYDSALVDEGSSRRRLKKFVALGFAALLGCLLAASAFSQRGGGAGRGATKQGTARQGAARQGAAKGAPTVAAFGQAPVGGRFNHQSARHAQIKCDQCHVRRADTIKPVMPGHRACISCHIKEFTSTQFAICANCHDGITAIEPKVLDFPERQSFGTEFSHKTHATFQSGGKRADCSDCHAVAGARATFPAHKECYVCHKAPDQVKPGETVGGASCGECHTATGNRKPHSAMSNAYSLRFTHQVHAEREKISCAECHSVFGEQATAQVSVPQLKEHLGAGFRSCGACHNGRRAFSGDAQGNCARCHGRPMM